MFVANDEALLQRRVEMVGTLLDDTLPLLSRSEREEQRTSRMAVGLAWTAHELRTPILGVKAALEVVAKRSAPRDDELLRLSLRELEQLAADTEGILGWAVGGRDLSPRYVDVAQLVEDAVTTYRLLHGGDRRGRRTAAGHGPGGSDAHPGRGREPGSERGPVL